MEFADIYKNELKNNKFTNYKNMQLNANNYALEDLESNTRQKQLMEVDHKEYCLENKNIDRKFENIDIQESIDKNRQRINVLEQDLEPISQNLDQIYDDLYEVFVPLQTQLNQFGLKPYQLSDPKNRQRIENSPNGTVILELYEEWKRLSEALMTGNQEYNQIIKGIDEVEEDIDEVYLNNMVVQTGEPIKKQPKVPVKAQPVKGPVKAPVKAQPVKAPVKAPSKKVPTTLPKIITAPPKKPGVVTKIPPTVTKKEPIPIAKKIPEVTSGISAKKKKVPVTVPKKISKK